MERSKYNNNVDSPCIVNLPLRGQVPFYGQIQITLVYYMNYYSLFCIFGFTNPEIPAIVLQTKRIIRLEE